MNSALPVGRVLVGIDGSPEAQAAAMQAADLAQKTGACLQLVFVVPNRPPPGPASFEQGPGRTDLIETHYAAALLHQLELQCARPGLVVEGMTALGPVAETLADLAAGGRADLVVVGHRGRGAVRRVLLGSVADRLVQISEVPVLVVR